MKKISIDQVEIILHEVFPAATYSEAIINLKLGDFEEWDSLGNFNLLLAFEEFCNIRFTLDEMTELKSIEQILKVINRD